MLEKTDHSLPNCLAQAAIENSIRTFSPNFVTPVGIRRHLPLFIFLPGLDGSVSRFGQARVPSRFMPIAVWHNVRVTLISCPAGSDLRRSHGTWNLAHRALPSTVTRPKRVPVLTRLCTNCGRGC